MKNEKGFIAITSILIVSAIVLAIGIGVSLRAIGETDMSLGEELSIRALNLADACAEDAMLKLKNNLSYSGDESIVIDGSNSCDILLVEGSGNNNRIIKTESLVGGYKRKVKVEITTVSPLNVASWGEVSDF